jgi:probable phosphoglycerate mutase
VEISDRPRRPTLSDVVEMPTTLFLVRHGRTPYNAGGRLRGLDDPPLDEVGQGEAAALGRLLADRRLDAVHASPLRRAMQTAGAIAAPHGLTPTADPDLRDRDYGRWTGMTRSAVEARFGTLHDAPGVEPAAAVARRFERVCRRALTRAPGGAVAVVAHDACNRLLLGKVMAVAADDIPQRTGALNELLVEPAGVRVLALDLRPGD